MLFDVLITYCQNLYPRSCSLIKSVTKDASTAHPSDMSVIRGQNSGRDCIFFWHSNRPTEKKVLTMCILKAVYIRIEYNLSDSTMQLLNIVHV